MAEIRTGRQRNLAMLYILLFLSVLEENVYGQNSDFTQLILSKAKEVCLFEMNGKNTGILSNEEKASLNPELLPFSNLHNAHILMDSARLDETYLETVEGLSKVQAPEIRELLFLLQARVQIAKGLYQEAKFSYEEYLKIRTSGTDDLVKQVSSSLATLYLVFKEYRAALRLFKENLGSFDEEKDKDYIKLVYHNMGLSYLHLQKLDSAEYFLNQSIELEKRMGDTVGLAISYMDIANLYYEQYMDEKAIPFFQLGLKTAELSGNPEAMMNANKNMAVVEENRKNYAEALTYRKAYEALQDSLWNRDRVWELAEQEKQFELSLKQNQILLLEEQEKAQNAALAAKNWQRNSLLISSVAFLLFIIALIWINRFLKQKNLVISKQKSELEELDRDKNRLYSIVAHDLKSPMRTLQRMNEKVATSLSGISPDDPAKAAIEENIEVTRKTTRLLDNLLHWSLDQSRQWVFQPEEHPISALVDQVIYDYEALIEAKQIQLSVEVSPQAMAIFDMQSMKIVLRNLLDNALKYSEIRSNISIITTENSDYLDLAVTDHGKGIDKEIIQHLFSLNREKVTSDVQGNTGTGLGLPLCKSLTEKNKGQLLVTSTVGQGTTVTIRFSKNVSKHAKT